jgi:hypothetical protein
MELSNSFAKPINSDILTNHSPVFRRWEKNIFCKQPSVDMVEKDILLFDTKWAMINGAKPET